MRPDLEIRSREEWPATVKWWGRGIFRFGGHSCPGEGRSASTRRSIALEIQTGSDRSRGILAVSDIAEGLAVTCPRSPDLALS